MIHDGVHKSLPIIIKKNTIRINIFIVLAFFVKFLHATFITYFSESVDISGSKCNSGCRFS